MEGFPVELVGNILSHVVNLKDVVRVSMACRKWRLALRYLHTLQQDYSDAPLSNRRQQLEFLLTDTILQTWSLQNLHICHETRFSATAVIAWLSHAGDSPSSDLRGTNDHTVCQHAGKMWENVASRKLPFAIHRYQTYNSTHHSSTIPISVVS